jgi:eukaryotic-like serine/threonine-protein kinase
MAMETEVGQGERIGPFTIERQLAMGGMSEAYLAHGPDGRAVVLKLPSAALLGDVAALARFKREGQALRQLDHPGIQRVIETGQSGRRPYLALEYVPGETLRAALERRKRFPVAEAVAVASALADALAHCHAHGVVHRDLKPDNVVLRGPEMPVLIDFGAALVEGARRLTFASFSGELGTPEYMAPEQVRGGRGDARTDIHGLGTVTYELLTGSAPFEARPGESAIQVMTRHLTEVPAAPDAQDLDPHLRGVLARSLARDPEHRFQDMKAFRAALLNPDAAVAAGETPPDWPATGDAGEVDAEAAGQSGEASPHDPTGLSPDAVRPKWAHHWDAAPGQIPTTQPRLSYVLMLFGVLLVMVVIGVLAVVLERPVTP